jgi:putative tryptophan/tyrosine transport system substrate-binding protein
MRRREFVTGLGGTMAWPLATRAQQPPTPPVIGFLDAGSLETRREFVAGVHRGLSETGYVEGRNLGVEYRWAEYRLDRLRALADDLVSRHVAVIVAPQTPAAFAAKAATKSIPIVFLIGIDPVELGLVASLNRPGGNLTGISNLAVELTTKRLELMHKVVPAATPIAFLVNPTAPVTEPETRELRVAARTLGVRLLILNAGDPSEFEAAFATLVREGAGGLLVSGDTVFLNNYDPLVALAARHRVPAMYPDRKHTAAGGLISYGTNRPESFRLVGVYTGRVLKGEKPADLPVQLASRLELIINVKIANALGLTIPETLLAIADEVIQ